jgi:predicted nuclease with RNAse H fold
VAGTTTGAYNRGVLTAGVDLAAERKGTALAVLRWSASEVTAEVELGVTDAEIGAVAPTVRKLGIDCAFGWPDDFVAFVSRHASGRRVGAGPDEGMAWRRRLSYRATDRATREITGRWPLSVATDRLGLTAMHCAVLLDAIGDSLGAAVDRSGGGTAVEVYPSAALRGWGFDTRGYKNDDGVRGILLDALLERAPWLRLTPGDKALRAASDDAFDAVIAALAARAHALGLTHPIPAADRDRASREGWIALPMAPLEDLAR